MDLNPVVDALATALGNADEIEGIGARAGLAMQRVRRSPRADICWQAVLLRALDEEKVHRVLEEALAWSAQREWHETVQHYRQAWGPARPG